MEFIEAPAAAIIDLIVKDINEGGKLYDVICDMT